jgi:hypothetical protein
MENIMKFFESWNQTVESAFSGVKFNKRAIEPMKIHASKDGLDAEFGERHK